MRDAAPDAAADEVFELENGVALAWISERRPSPAWPDMERSVHRELRGRFANEVLPPGDLVTYLDDTP